MSTKSIKDLADNEVEKTAFSKFMWVLTTKTQLMIVGSVRVCWQQDRSGSNPNENNVLQEKIF